LLQAEGITVDSASAVTAADVGSAAAGQPDDSSFVLLRLKSRHLAHASAAADNAHRQQQQQHAQQEYQQQDGQGFQQEHAMIAVAQVQQAASTGFEQVRNFLAVKPHSNNGLFDLLATILFSAATLGGVMRAWCGSLCMVYGNCQLCRSRV
jgi:hypothetical protein